MMGGFRWWRARKRRWKAGVGDEAAPAVADEGGAGERGGQRREAEEDLGEEVVVVRQGHRRRR